MAQGKKGMLPDGELVVDALMLDVAPWSSSAQTSSLKSRNISLFSFSSPS
jgi:hypothetical protein